MYAEAPLTGSHLKVGFNEIFWLPWFGEICFGADKLLFGEPFGLTAVLKLQASVQSVLYPFMTGRTFQCIVVSPGRPATVNLVVSTVLSIRFFLNSLSTDN